MIQPPPGGRVVEVLVLMEVDVLIEVVVDVDVDVLEVVEVLISSSSCQLGLHETPSSDYRSHVGFPGWQHIVPVKRSIGPPDRHLA